ncbi:hypothetical protein DBR34_16365 [Stenotrophomonas sp. HMWF003]|nr:hypothetical protein DBR34_16365 [Stenotrophomonas sp. HMWF003]
MPAATVTAPSAVMARPAGAPTSDSSTLATAGGVMPLSESLASTEVVLPPLTGLIGVLLKSSPVAARLPTVRVMAALAVAHSAAFGAGRQTW